MLLKLPPHFESLEENDEKQRIRTQVEKSLLLFSYNSETQRENPFLAEVFQIPHLQLIKDTSHFATNSWESGILPLRKCLVRLSRNWNEVCPDQPCPFSFTHEELDEHIREGEGFNEAADFWSSISHIVTREGFVLPEDYESAFDMFAELKTQGLQTLEGQERDQFDLAPRWAIRQS